MDKTLCKIRDVVRVIIDFEQELQAEFELNLNEAMLLCSLKNQDNLSSGEISQLLALKTSNTSKVIGSVEDKGFVKRTSGKEDKRQMYFSLTQKGMEKIKSIYNSSISIPNIVIERTCN